MVASRFDGHDDWNRRYKDVELIVGESGEDIDDNIIVGVQSFETDGQVRYRWVTEFSNFFYHTFVGTKLRAQSLENLFS